MFHTSAPQPARARPRIATRSCSRATSSRLVDLVPRRVDGFQCLFNGSIKCLDGDSNEIVAELSYGTPSVTVPAKLWSDPTSDPLADIEARCDSCLAQSAFRLT